MSERQAKDTRALGILALSWNFLVASLPAEVSEACIEAISAAGLPSMTVRGDATGMHSISTVVLFYTDDLCIYRFWIHSGFT